MKFGLFLALLVLLASTNVFGQQQGTGSGRKRPTGFKTTPPTDDQDIPDRVTTSIQRDAPLSKTTVVVNGDNTPIRSSSNSPRVMTTVHREEQPAETTVIVKGNDTPIRTGPNSARVTTTVHRGEQPVKTTVIESDQDIPDRSGTDSSRIMTNVEHEEKPVRTTIGVKPVAVIREETQPIKVVHEEVQPVGEKWERNPEDLDEMREPVKPDMGEPKRKPERPIKESRPREDEREGEAVPVDGGKDIRPTVEVAPISEKTVHISGNVILVKYRSTFVDSVQYDLDGTRLSSSGGLSSQARLPFAQDFIARQSRVTLYVSTSKTIDRKLAFAKFPLKYSEDHFPLSFDIDIDLPSQQRGLLERADITLYFFVYVKNLETRIDTFLPAGTSQILLQGTNRLVQKLDVYVRASGIEVTGLFRGRFGQRYIRPGTSFQVFVVPEQSLNLINSPSFESVAQLTLTNVPAMFPVPFSLLVHHQMLKPDVKYYAIAYVYENGIRRLINQAPIWVVNEQKVLVTSQVIFTVIPSPFILRGSVTRSMPGSFFLQPHSSLILRLHELGAGYRNITFRLPEILTLPQVFQINISQAIQFDPSKNYEIRAIITDERDNVYMATLQPIPLLDEFSRLTVPVDDLLYYVQARLQSSSNQLLNYIPGSTAQVFVTDSPETPVKPIVSIRIDSIPEDFREFSLQVPATAIQRNRNYYLVMMIVMNGMITHVSKTLLISNNQPPPLLIQLPVLSLNLVSGVIFDVENRPAQWSSSSYASLFLLDDKAENPDKAIVQVWKIHLENDFPVRFEVQLDFSRLRSDRVYRLQGAIENGRNMLEYKPAGSVLTLNPNGGIITDVRIPVHNVKTFQEVKGLVYINDFRGALPDKSVVIVQLSSSPSLLNPSIISELQIKVDGRTLPIDFTMKLPLDKIDINSVYYFLVRYVVRGDVVIPTSQAFAFSPRNDATVVLTLSKTPQIPITGQVTSTGSSLILPADSTLHLYITDDSDHDKPVIFNEVFLQASSNSLYEFTMNIDSLILQKKIPLYLRADILFEDKIILSIPRPALLQISPGGEWNINLVIDLPTLLIGRIVSMSQQEAIGGEFDVHIEILETGTTTVVDTTRLRLAANLPQPFRIELDNDLFSRFPSLQVRALIKNCKGQILFESGGVVSIHTGININVDLSVVLTDRTKFTELQTTVNELAPLRTGIWRLSVTGVVTDIHNNGFTALDSFAPQK